MAFDHMLFGVGCGDKMYRIALVVPYYGKLPSFFRAWAYTAGFLEQQMIDFILLTDLEIGFELPNNIKVFKMSFDELKRRVQSKFDFKISLDTPYKLCDYKPAYGFIFSDMLKKYSFWGHCDVDVLWGDVRKFVTDEILASYDKIQYLGHFVLYRNCCEMNQLFMKKAGLFHYRKVFSTPEYYSFDEHPGMMQIVQKYNVKNYIAINQADISPRFKNLVISRVSNFQNQVLYWHDGVITRAYIDVDGTLRKDEYMYAHFQQKAPVDKVGWSINAHPYMIRYSWNALEAICEESLLMECQTIDSDERSENADEYKKKKIRKFLRSNSRQKIITVCILILTKRTNRFIRKKYGLKI